MTNPLDLAFERRPIALIVSLPRNEPELARAAREGGADALKAHLNVRHAASGSEFGPFEREKERFAEILKAAPGLAAGVMPGAETTARIEEMNELANMGFSFFDIYAKHMPAAYWGISNMAAMPALAHGEPHATASGLAALGARHLEASVASQDLYGAPLTAADLAAYSDICRRFGGAVTVPTQKAIQPEDVRWLVRAGIRGLMIGAVVTGGTAEGIASTTEKFRKAIDALTT